MGDIATAAPLTDAMVTTPLIIATVRLTAHLTARLIAHHTVTGPPIALVTTPQDAMPTPQSPIAGMHPQWERATATRNPVGMKPYWRSCPGLLNPACPLRTASSVRLRPWTAWTGRRYFQPCAERSACMGRTVCWWELPPWIEPTGETACWGTWHPAIKEMHTGTSPCPECEPLTQIQPTRDIAPCWGGVHLKGLRGMGAMPAEVVPLSRSIELAAWDETSPQTGPR